jgi:hypothetical protein
LHIDRGDKRDDSVDIAAAFAADSYFMFRRIGFKIYYFLL